MSIIKSLQSWIERFPGLELKPFSVVMTDLTKQVPSSYAIAPIGDGKTETDLAGNHTYTKNYAFYARESLNDEIDRQDNHEFLDALVEWIEACDDSNDYPVLPGAYAVDSVSVSNCLLHNVDDDGNGIYFVQIQLIITKWRE